MYDVDYIFDRHSVSHILVPVVFFKSLKLNIILLFICTVNLSIRIN